MSVDNISMTPGTLWVVDTGLSSATANVAIDKAWLNGYPNDGFEYLLRFYQSTPSVWIGAHQWPECEARLEWCKERSVDVVRRLSGGGAIYVDSSQLGWSLFLSQRHVLGQDEFSSLHRLAAEAIARALSRIEVRAEFIGPNDVEIDGRKIASCFARRGVLCSLIHGVILIDIDVASALHALRVPTEKLSPDGLSGARKRLTTIKEQLATVPPLGTIRRALEEEISASLRMEPSSGPDVLYARMQEQFRNESAYATDAIRGQVPRSAEIRNTRSEAVLKTPQGLLRARIDADPDGEVAELQLSGDIFVHPHELFDRLSGASRGVGLVALRTAITDYLSGVDIRLQGCSIEDLMSVVALAVDRNDQKETLGLSVEQANTLMVLGGRNGVSVVDILAKARAMLIPYCAKPLWCKWRNRDGCSECGHCDVGVAYAHGRRYGLKVISIRNYEHLTETLGKLREDGVQGLIGMCCEQFFIKRNRAFVDSGIQMVLMDISGSNCYELGREEQAYAGVFDAMSRLNIPVLERVIRRIPHHGNKQADTKQRSL